MRRKLLLMLFMIKTCLNRLNSMYDLQTGTGKTYTMWGPAGAMVDGSSVNGEQGVAPRLFRMLFSEIHRVGSVIFCLSQLLKCN